MVVALRRISLALILAAGFLIVAGAGNAPRVYRNEAMRVRAFEAPAGWELAPQSSYPRLLASYSHHEGGKLTLSAQKVPPGTTSMDLAEQSRIPLQKQGFTALRVHADGSRARLEADLDGGKRFIKQLYVVEGGIGYVVTMIGPLHALSRMAADYEESLKSLQVGGDALDAGVAR